MVSIIDIDDEKPYFTTPLIQKVQISELSKISSIVAIVAVEDKDIASEVTFSIINANVVQPDGAVQSYVAQSDGEVESVVNVQFVNPFFIISSKNIGKIILTAKLNASSQSQYTLHNSS